MTNIAYLLVGVFAALTAWIIWEVFFVPMPDGSGDDQEDSAW